MIQFPGPPPAGTPDIPPPGAVCQFLACVALILLAVELLLTVLPEGWQRKVNRIRFGPDWKG